MKNPSKKLLCCALLLAAGNGCFGAGDSAPQGGLFNPGEWKAVSAEKLDTMRGGYETSTGMTVSFGVVRTVSINGDVVNRTSFNLPDVSKITADQARAVSTALNEANIVQNGTGNVVSDSVRTQLSGGTLIQNSLNNQTIQTLTVINAGVGSLGLFKSINLQGVLRDSLFGSFSAR
jgi:hypothetical protein